jgi:hypothetical protein
MTPITPKRRALLAGLALLTAAASGGCRAEPTAAGLGDSVVALYATSVYGLDESLHGRVILVDADGAIQTVETEGIYLGSLSWDGSHLFASDSEGEIVADEVTTRRIDRDVEHDMEWWSGMVGSRRWTLFNDGTLGTDDYHTGVSSTDGSSIIEGDVVGDVVGTASCGEHLMLAIGRWAAPRDPRSTIIAQVVVRDGQIRTERRAPVALPKGGRVVNMSCDGGEPVVLARAGGTLLIGRESTGGRGFVEWTDVPSGSPKVSGDELVLGIVDGELYVWEPYAGVRALDLRTLRTRQVVETGMDGTGIVGMAGSQLVAWEPGEPAVRWYDPVSGDVVREVSGDRIIETLEKHDEMVEGPPVALH